MIIGIDSLVAHAKWENFILKLSAVGMVLFHFYALFFVTLSYYPAKSVAGFFQYTSQYKPDFFKSPFTEVLLAITAFVFLLFLYQFITKPEKQTIKNNNTRSR